MSRLLYIQASPREARSHSRAVAAAFVDAYRSSHPGDEVETLDIFKMDLPPFDGAVLQAKYNILHGQESTASEQEAWKGVEAVIEQFKSADRYLLAVPMWNFGIPYRLKQYFDVIVQPGYTFASTPGEGYVGLVTERPAVVVYARGGEYAPGTETAPYDLQKPYMEAILGFMGITDVRPVIVEPTLAGGPEAAAGASDKAVSEMVALATGF